MVKVLLLGATGYLGGTVLTNLENAEGYELTALVRPGNETYLANRKATAVICDHTDFEAVEKLCAEHDVVINAATSDDLDLTRAINRGLARGKLAGQSKGVLVHISGTQLIESEPTGELMPVPKYDDMDVAQISGIPETALHRLIDLEVERADLAGELTASIICPGVIFGRGTGPKKTISSPFPNIIRLALRNKRVVYASKGTNIWAHVHIQDVADLIVASMRHNLQAQSPAGFERFYFAENGEHEKRQLSTSIAAILSSSAQLIPAEPPLSVTLDDPRVPSWANRTTARCTANRARQQLSWAPKFILEDMLEEEVLDVVGTVRSEFGL